MKICPNCSEEIKKEAKVLIEKMKNAISQYEQNEKEKLDKEIF